jgi:hypothetical protein
LAQRQTRWRQCDLPRGCGLVAALAPSSTTVRVLGDSGPAPRARRGLDLADTLLRGGTGGSWRIAGGSQSQDDAGSGPRRVRTPVLRRRHHVHRDPGRDRSGHSLVEDLRRLPFAALTRRLDELASSGDRPLTGHHRGSRGRLWRSSTDPYLASAHLARPRSVLQLTTSAAEPRSGGKIEST